MKLDFEYIKPDFLEYQLYVTATSKLFQKRLMQVKSIYPISFVVLGGVLAYFTHSNTAVSAMIVVMFCILAIVWYLFYPNYYKRKYESYLDQYIDEQYTKQMHVPSTLLMDKKGIKFSNEEATSFLKAKSINKLIELHDQFIIVMKNEEKIIVPRRAIQDEIAWLELMQMYEVETIDARNWKW